MFPMQYRQDTLETFGEFDAFILVGAVGSVHHQRIDAHGLQPGFAVLGSGERCIVVHNVWEIDQNRHGLSLVAAANQLRCVGEGVQPKGSGARHVDSAAVHVRIEPARAGVLGVGGGVRITDECARLAAIVAVLREHKSEAQQHQYRSHGTRHSAIRCPGCCAHEHADTHLHFQVQTAHLRQHLELS